MRKLMFTLGFILLVRGAYCQSYMDQLAQLNNFLKTFDNGYYGHLEITDNTLYDYYKSGTWSKMNIYDVSEASVVDANRKIAIFCKSGNCVTTNTGAPFDNMPFSTNADFSALDFAAKLNSLIAAFKTSDIIAKIKTASPFPVGTKVKILKEDLPYKLSETLEDEARSRVTVVGKVITSDLQLVEDNWYSGRIKLNDGTVKQYKKAQFEIQK